MRRLARRRSARSAAGVHLVDGPVLLAEALDAGVVLDAVFVEPAAAADPAVGRAAGAGIEVVPVADGTLAKVLDLVTPRHVVAVARSVAASVADVLAGPGGAVAGPVLALVGLQDPGNVGTLVRVAEAAGCDGVVITAGSVDVHNPKCVRATAGSLFRVPVAEGVPVADLLGAVARSGRTTVATVGRGSGSGAVPVGAPEDAALADGPVILLGAEAHGLPAELVAACDVRVSVPMAGAVESLNASVAGAVVAFEAARQRRVRERS